MLYAMYLHFGKLSASHLRLCAAAHGYFLFFLAGHHICAQPSEMKNTPHEYILRYKEIAIHEMFTNGIPASITLAQGMLESGSGNSALSVYANNHFGIKCHKEWLGETYVMDDDEKDECFRRYEKVADSYRDHSNFLRTRQRYAFLFDLPLNDYRSWAKGLKQAGYATLPSYAEQLIELIERYHLDEYDKHPKLTLKAFRSETPKIKAELRSVNRFNHIKFIITKKGDTFSKIASEFNIKESNLLKYNDLTVGEQVLYGTKLFLERKRKKADEEFHIVGASETLHSISQMHGIRLFHLCKKNRIKKGDALKIGDILYLRHKKPRKSPLS